MIFRKDVKTFGKLCRAVVEWGDRTFPDARPRSIFNHLEDEVKELSNAICFESREAVEEEIGDILHLLAHLGSKYGVSLELALRKKFIVNQTRQWGKPDERGVIRHVEEKKDEERTDREDEETPRGVE